MNHTKTYVTCVVCKKELLETSFNKHLRTHDNPLSRNCKKWYKNNFHNDNGVCVCNHCDEEIHGEYSFHYEEHLQAHGITNK